LNPNTTADFFQHVDGFQTPNWIPAFAGMTDGAVEFFVGTVAFFLKESRFLSSSQLGQADSAWIIY